jgi:NAD(P)-dependent dehydrogenase (short-subunit alcohol dehydrogenase family)
MRDPNAVIHLVPGVGLISFAKDKTTARQAAEFYINAINVMRGASGVDTYVALPEQEAFDIEYWLLEEAKLQRMPKPKALNGKVAVVTGGAGGIGAAIAERLIGEGAVVMIADRDSVAAENIAAGFRKTHGRDCAHAIAMDVTSEEQVISTFAETARLHGGVDIIVNNAGISSAAAVEDTSLELWNRNMSILATGYFLVAREGYKLLKTQGFGGSLIFIGSKNGVAASAGASAYCTAKAAEIHLARCMALEGAAHGIRVNVVNPDAVLRGSKIWQGEWRQQRAANNKIAEDDLEEFYRNRSLLKRSVFPEDIAEAVHFFANEGLSGKSTGNFLNVDAGNAQSFTR